MRISDWSSDVCSSDLPDADRCAIILVVGQGDGLRYTGPNPAGKLLSDRVDVEGIDDDDEFVTADAGGEIILAQRFLDARRQCDEHGSACGVAEINIDRREIVDRERVV